MGTSCNTGMLDCPEQAELLALIEQDEGYPSGTLPESRPFSWFKSATQTLSCGLTNLKTVIHATRQLGPQYSIIQDAQSLTEAIYAARATGKEDTVTALRKEQQNLKKLLSMFTVTGIFEHRKNDGGRAFTRLLCLDFDHLREHGVELEALRARLMQDPYVLAVFASPSGDGLKAFVFYAGTFPGLKGHRHAYMSALHHFQYLGEALLDKGVHDISRGCYLSYDPDAFLNEEALLLRLLPASTVNDMEAAERKQAKAAKRGSPMPVAAVNPAVAKETNGNSTAVVPAPESSRRVSRRSWLGASWRERICIAIDTVTIPQAGAAIELPVTEGKQCSPLREDKDPSFSVFAEGRMFKDFATGESGNVYTFLTHVFPECSKTEINSILLDIYEGLPTTERIRVNSEEEALAVAEVDDPRRPPEVKQQFAAGIQALDPAMMQSLAERRGWPHQGVVDLVETGRVAYMGRSEASDACDGISFLVERRAPDGRLIPVGYHRRFQHENGEVGWAYSPKGVKSHPFVALNNSLKHVVVTEGQWDAWTARLAYGADFDGTILGLRGVHGVGAFLKYWAPDAIKAGARFLIIAQNDKPGLGLIDPHNPQGLYRRLRDLGGAVETVSFGPEEEIKDLNDLWKANGGIPKEQAIAWLTPKKTKLENDDD